MTTLYSRVVRAWSNLSSAQVRSTERGIELELPPRELYKLLWSYYHNNGLYEELRRLGHFSDNQTLKAIRNPARRAVEFYASTIWPGALPAALPIRTQNDRIVPAIERLWAWSNWSQQKQAAVRTAGITGEVWIKVAQAKDSLTGEYLPRVYLQRLDPMFVTEFELDERGYVDSCRIDVPQTRKEGERIIYEWTTEAWDREVMRRWVHERGPDTPLPGLGVPAEEVALTSWGIDFVPLVQVQHLTLGDEHGTGAFLHVLEKIDELNVMATRLHKVLFRHNDVTWALQANGVDAAGRPLPPPKIGSSALGPSSGDDTVELGGERLLRLPGNATLAPLVPALDYQAHLNTIADQYQEIRRDLPELAFWELQDLPEMSGRALRLFLSPALALAQEVRGNFEAGLSRAHAMALTIGKEVKAWSEHGIADPGDYASGDYDHAFDDRGMIKLSRHEIAELAQTETQAGMPLVTSLRRSGWEEDEIEELLADQEAASTAQQAGLASALSEAQNRFMAGQDAPPEL